MNRLTSLLAHFPVRSRAAWLVVSSGLLVIMHAFGVLWPSYAEEAHPAAEVSVAVGRVIQTDIRDYVQGYGMVEPAPPTAGRSGGAKLSAPVAGIIVSVPVSEGQAVKAGTIIVRLDDRTALATLEKDTHALEFARQQNERQRRLYAAQATSTHDLEEADELYSAARAELAAARAALAQLQLTTPLDGLVAKINVSPGQAVDQSTILAEVVDPDRLVVSAKIPASEARNLVPGAAAEILLEGTDRPVAGSRVLFVSPEVDVPTGTVLARVSVPRGLGIRAGEFVRTRIVSQTLAKRLAVPFDAIVRRDGGAILFVVKNGHAREVAVTIGSRDGALVEVHSPSLRAGDTIVTTGAYGLPDGVKIHVTRG